MLLLTTTFKKLGFGIFKRDLCNAGTDTSAGSMQWAIAKFINYPNAFMAGGVGHGAKLICTLARHVLEHGSLIHVIPYVDAVIFTLQNRCKKTIWPGITPGSGKPQLMDGGLELRPGKSVDINATQGCCVTGDCGGVLKCAGAGVSIFPSGGFGECKAVTCVSNLNQRCPKDLACMAFNKPEYCCSGAYRTPETCKPTEYSKVFKASCPTS
ncbi:hypothetical protein AAG906_020826 [Vitis piasezkii]